MDADPGSAPGMTQVGEMFDEDGMVKLSTAGKFKSGKAASIAARELQEKKNNHGQQNAADAAAEAMLREYDFPCEGSLMDQHLAMMDAKKAKKSSKGVKRDGFDYERHSPWSTHFEHYKRNELVKEASMLSSRFDKTIQR